MSKVQVPESKVKELLAAAPKGTPKKALIDLYKELGGDDEMVDQAIIQMWNKKDEEGQWQEVAPKVGGAKKKASVTGQGQNKSKDFKGQRKDVKNDKKRSLNGNGPAPTDNSDSKPRTQKIEESDAKEVSLKPTSNQWSSGRPTFTNTAVNNPAVAALPEKTKDVAKDVVAPTTVENVAKPKPLASSWASRVRAKPAGKAPVKPAPEAEQAPITSTSDVPLIVDNKEPVTNTVEEETSLEPEVAINIPVVVEETITPLRKVEVEVVVDTRPKAIRADELEVELEQTAITPRASDNVDNVLQEPLPPVVALERGLKLSPLVERTQVYPGVEFGSRLRPEISRLEDLLDKSKYEIFPKGTLEKTKIAVQENLRRELEAEYAAKLAAAAAVAQVSKTKSVNASDLESEMLGSVEQPKSSVQYNSSHIENSGSAYYDRYEDDRRYSRDQPSPRAMAHSQSSRNLPDAPPGLTKHDGPSTSPQSSYGNQYGQGVNQSMFYTQHQSQPVGMYNGPPGMPYYPPPPMGYYNQSYYPRNEQLVEPNSSGRGPSIYSGEQDYYNARPSSSNPETTQPRNVSGATRTQGNRDVERPPGFAPQMNTPNQYQQHSYFMPPAYNSYQRNQGPPPQQGYNPPNWSGR